MNTSLLLRSFSFSCTGVLAALGVITSTAAQSPLLVVDQLPGTGNHPPGLIVAAAPVLSGAVAGGNLVFSLTTPCEPAPIAIFFFDWTLLNPAVPIPWSLSPCTGLPGVLNVNLGYTIVAFGTGIPVQTVLVLPPFVPPGISLYGQAGVIGVGRALANAVWIH